ncbi:PREDICTED: uncharacterized protein LOC107188043 [Dufourea novaeangliae]|uniref:WAP domain-containing protein n=1 Tax=Dufourea novaeangliae TaxID=178035 RepID=A0A154PDJ2_DUFNO|nr:PREDICTED: uncharacterized protein LOC107188043 [Dufourea novaeangliae]KZC09877.1 hypothetical protein WN55_00523 [Dufourea novaeangliae]
MNRLFLVLLFVCAVSATRCIIKDDKDEPEVHVIRLGDRSGDSDESEVVALNIPDSRRKREADKSCKKDSDCPTGRVCVPLLGCVKGHRKNPILHKLPHA